jgi:hypothetical protein
LIDSIHCKKIAKIYAYRYVNYFFEFVTSLLFHVYYKEKDVIKETDKNKDMLELENVFLCNCFTVGNLVSLISIALDKAIECAKSLINDSLLLNADSKKHYSDFKRIICEIIYHNTNNFFNAYVFKNRVHVLKCEEKLDENLMAFKTLIENPGNYLFCFHDKFKNNDKLSLDDLNHSTHIVGNFIFRFPDKFKTTFECGKIKSVVIAKDKDKEKNCMYVIYHINEFGGTRIFTYEGGLCRAICLEQKNECVELFYKSE